MSFFGGEHFKCQTVAVLKFWQGLSIGMLGATAQYIPSYITDFIQSVCCAAAAAAVTKSHYFAWNNGPYLHYTSRNNSARVQNN